MGYPPREAIDELFRANSLWNTLVALHRESKENWDDARRAASILYSEKMDELESKQEELLQAFAALRQARMEESTKDESNPRLKSERAIINRLKAEQGEIFVELKPLRKEADSKIDKKALNDDFRIKCNQAVSVKNSKVYSRTADQVHADFKTARKKSFKENATMRFHPFDGTGYFQFRCKSKDRTVTVDGVSVEDFMSANFVEHRRCAVTKVDNTRKKPKLRINAVLAGGSNQASRIFHEFDCVYHRPLPPECKIQNGKILRTRTGDKFKYDLVLTVKIDDPKHIDPRKLKGTIGIDIGFRKSGDTVLVATVLSDEVEAEQLEIKAPSKMVSALEHVIDLQGELDYAANDLGKAITPLMKQTRLAKDHQKYNFCKSITDRPANVTLSYEKAYKLAIWLNHEPNALSNEITTKVFTWWRSYSRKYRELHNRRRKQLTHRKHFYREAAASIAAQQKLIVLEKINLARFAETKDKDTKLNNKVRAQRFLASVSELRDAIKNAADREGVPYIEVNPAYTSKTCSECGAVNKELKAEKEWTCQLCGVVHDRDTNAANNLQNMGKQYLDGIKNKDDALIE
jgi:IS605 OrfB family transposase